MSDDLRPEYDFTELRPAGPRGAYAKRYAEEGVNVVLLDPDVRAAFPTSEAVNTALRGLMRNSTGDAGVAEGGDA